MTKYWSGQNLRVSEILEPSQFAVVLCEVVLGKTCRYYVVEDDIAGGAAIFYQQIYRELS